MVNHLQNGWILQDIFFWLASLILLFCTVGTTPVEGNSIFKTLTSSWSECHRINSTLGCYRTREAVCLRSSDNLTAPWYYCTDQGLQRPEVVDECVDQGYCQQNCAASQWSAWTSCNCSQNFFRNRSREVISPPRNGGLVCPPLLEQEVCECAHEQPFDTQTRRHTWQTEDWGPCRALDNSSQCDVGLRSRTIRCVNIEGETVDDEKCVQEPAYSLLVPPSSQTHCELPCLCVLGQWGAFSPCTAQCNQRIPTGIQRRSRSVIQSPTHGLSCANNDETRACILTENTCPVYSWISSDWSQCNVQAGATCGNGYATRFVYCLEVWNGIARYTDHFLCEKLANTTRPAEIMVCSVSCPQACLVGEWSAWSQCPRACNQTYRNRTRSILVPSINDVCPHLLEFLRCPVLPCARWLPGNFFGCIGSSECGQGTQARLIDCVGPNNDVILDGECDHLVRPDSIVTCRVPCSNDCVVSDWSEWSHCSETCGGHVGRQLRMRHLVAHGDNCPYNNTDLTETRNCSSDEDCNPTIFSVQQLTCGVCVPEIDNVEPSNSPLTDQLGRSCVKGGTCNRTSVCMHGGSVIPESECPIQFQSVKTETCELPCSRECVYSEWSPFSECSVSCGMGTQSRSRHLIHFSDSGSTPCNVDNNGFNVESIVCFSSCDTPDEEVLGGVAWKTTEWSPCYLYKGISPQGFCGIGYRNRTVSCVDIGSGLMVMESECESLLVGEFRPAAVKNCYVKCLHECLITEWSELNQCMYGGTRRRERNIVPHSGCEVDDWELCCPHLTTVSLQESIQCPSVEGNYQYHQPLPFGTCILESAGDICGNGMQYRRNVCANLHFTDSGTILFHPVDDAFCSFLGLTRSIESQVCNVKCERDCIQTDWSAWSSCSVSCGSGNRTRSRTILTPPEPRGRQCGSALEMDVCFSAPCPRVEVVPGPFGRCNASNRLTLCGDGMRSRGPVCLVDGVPRDLGECGTSSVATFPFPLNEACQAACVGDCVLGEWQEWTPCPTNCPTGSCQQTRQRPILRGSQSSCSEPITEFRSCNAPVNPYLWSVGPWNDCIVGSLKTSIQTVSQLRGHYCGLGLTKRLVTCVEGTAERTVHDSYCVDAGVVRPGAVENCSLPCPVDCKVGTFSDWTECEGCELVSYQQRERQVFVSPQFGGQECPELVQSRQCTPVGCVLNRLINHTSLENVDYTEHAQCGSVLTEEPLSCLRNTKFVSPLECLGNATRVERYVTLSCPSEPNCTFTEWTDWSDCVSLAIYPGRPFRFRYRRLVSSLSLYTTDCASAQHQTEECLTEPEVPTVTGVWNGTEKGPTSALTTGSIIIDFTWKTSEWNANGRDVYCISNTNIRVENPGCPASLKPRSLNETCENITCPDYATCDDSGGVCAQSCEINFEPVGDMCLPLSGCLSHTHCLIANTECNPVAKTCDCTEKYHRSEVSVC